MTTDMRVAHNKETLQDREKHHEMLYNQTLHNNYTNCETDIMEVREIHEPQNKHGGESRMEYIQANKIQKYSKTYEYDPNTHMADTYNKN